MSVRVRLPSYALYAGRPRADTITPSSGPLAGGTPVRIDGYRLADATAVLIGVTTVPFETDGPNGLVCTTPAGSAPGSVQVGVILPAPWAR